MTASSSSKRKKFREQRRLEIISAASQVLSDKGLNSFTVKDVSDSMGIGRGTLYEHIKTKNDILFIIMEDALIRASQMICEEVAREEEPIAKLMAAVRTHIRTIRQHSMAVLLLYQDAVILEKHQFKRIRELVEEYHLTFQKIFNQGKELGIFNCEDTHLLAHSTTALLNTWLLKKNFVRKQISFEKYGDLVGRMAIQGLLNLSSPDLERNIELLDKVLAEH